MSQVFRVKGGNKDHVNKSVVLEIEDAATGSFLKIISFEGDPSACMLSTEVSLNGALWYCNWAIDQFKPEIVAPA